MKPSVEKRIIERLTGFAEAVERRQPITEQFTCRKRILKLKPKPYDPKMVKKARSMLGASQAVFAIFLGVSPKTVQAWESGDLSPNNMACRFMDLIQHNCRLFRQRLEEMFAAK